VAANEGRVIMNANADAFSADELWVGGPLPKMHSLTLSGGTLQHTDGSTAHKTSRIGDGASDSDPGVITQTGGTLYMNKGEMRIGANVTTPSHGLYDISGGTLSTAGGLYAGGGIVLGSRMNQFATGPTTGELRISGTATVNLGAPATAPQALGFGAAHGEAGSSILSVSGALATIHVDSLQMANSFVGYNAGLINYSFDETGVSTIHVTKTANLAQGMLNVNYTGTPLAYGTTFDLIVADVITTNASFTLDPGNSTLWQLAKLGDGLVGEGSDTLQLVYLGNPPLAITHAGDQLIVSWPAAAAGWTLQTSEDLSPPTWVNYAGTVVNNTATLDPATGNLFFRLTQ
jgi:hypothetical protein